MKQPVSVRSALNTLSLVICLMFIMPTQTQVVSKVITADVMDNLIKIADAHFFNSGALYPIQVKKFLRAAFHDCMGGCDGAININNPENRGLEDLARKLDQSYLRSPDTAYLNLYLSRADWWVLTELRALGWGIKTGSAPAPFNISTSLFKYGRGNAPNSSYDNYESEFPDARADWNTIMSKMNSGLVGLSESDIVTLLGLHGCGTMNMDNSGFAGPWGNSSDLNNVNNHFYVNLFGIDSRVKLEQVTSDKVAFPFIGTKQPFHNSTAPSQNRIMWTNNGRGDARNFLNADVEIYLNITVASDGNTSAKYYPQGSSSLANPVTPAGSYPPLSRNANLGYSYAKNNKLYTPKLIDAFIRLNNVISEYTLISNLKSFSSEIACVSGVMKCKGDILFANCGSSTIGTAC